MFPFDLFGGAGAGAGAALLADALREAVDDTAAEPQPTRPHAFADRLTFEEHPFDTLAAVAGWRAAGRSAARRMLASGGFGLWLAGNHLGVLPVYEELTADDLVVQFDAHLDCYALHDTQDELCHGNFLLHAERADGRAGPTVVNVGHRDLFLRPSDVARAFAQAHPAEAVFAAPAGVAADLRMRAKAAKRVWVDLDVDVFDPAYCPAVADPLPFGLTPQQFWPLFEAAWAGKMAGLSVSEFAPGRDVRDTSLNLLGWLLERVLLKQFE